MCMGSAAKHSSLVLYSLNSRVYIKGVPGLTPFTAGNTGSASSSPGHHILTGQLTVNWTVFKGQMVKGLETILYKK